MHESTREPQQADMKLVGNNTASGGVYRNVSITGDVEIGGGVDFRSFKCIGNANVDGSLRGGELKTTGNLGVKGSLEAARIRLTGDMEVKGALTGEEIHIFGGCAVKAGIQGGQFHLKGSLQSEGMLNAEHVNIRLLGRSTVGEIVGTRVEIKLHASHKWVPWLPLRDAPELAANVIEGDIVYLENTVAKAVRGEQVTIGPNCRIELVEYRTGFHQDSCSEVARSVRHSEK
ncbi:MULTISPECIES: hypothetical protein [Paenibacillus]|uniref:hypothetical protein n=1 Tax=Paenibacillus TaxID=44249 RepID=UPI002FE2201A